MTCAELKSGVSHSVRKLSQFVQRCFSLFIELLAVIGLLIGCQDPDSAFSPGTGDPRITGTWQLVERRFLRDSTYSVRIDTLNTTRDTTYYALRRYPANPPQTLTFGADGSLSASGSEMTYYYPIRYFRVDSTADNGLSINLFISTNRANIAFQQTIEFRRDTLVVLPRCLLRDNCDLGYYLKFARVR